MIVVFVVDLLSDIFAVCIKQKKYPGREALILYHNGF